MLKICHLTILFHLSSFHHTGLSDSSRSFVLWGCAHDTPASEESSLQYSLYNSNLVTGTSEDILYICEYGVRKKDTEISAWKARELSFNLFPSIFCILQFFQQSTDIAFIILKIKIKTKCHVSFLLERTKFKFYLPLLWHRILFSNELKANCTEEK